MHKILRQLKSIWKIGIFLLIFAILFMITEKIMIPKWQDGSEAETDKFNYYYSLPHDTLDYIVIGTSPSYFDVNIMQIYAESDIVGYNLGTVRQSIELSYYWLKEALKTQSPSVVFWEASRLFDSSTTEADIVRALVQMRFSANKIQAIRDCKNETQNFFEVMFPLVQFHNRWDSLTKDDWNKPSNNYYLYGTYVSFSNNLSTNKKERITDYNVYNLSDDKSYQIVDSIKPYVSENAKTYFEKMLKLCEENHVKLVPIKAPVIGWNKEKSKVIQDYLNKYGIELLDLTDDSLVPIMWEKDTADWGYHTNYWGASKTSCYLSAYLNEQDFTNNGNDKGHNEWNDNLDKYCQWEQENLLSLYPYDTYNYLNILSENKEKYLVIISVGDEASGAWNETLEASMHRMGVKNSFFNEGQNSFVGIIDSGESIFEKWDDHQITVNANYPVNESTKVALSVSSAGFMCGNTSSVCVNNVEYSLNNRGVNIVVIDKQTCDVVSSISIDSHVKGLTFNEMQLEGQSDIWQEMSETSQLVKDGVYNIVSSGNQNCVVDVPYGNVENGENIWLCERNGDIPQEFEISHVGDGLYTIRAVCSDKYLAIEGMGSTAGSNVIQESYTGLANQKWFITENSNGSYSFTSLYNGNLLDVAGGTAISGTNIQVWEANGEPPQQFFLEAVK